jgi:hypothetical protein
MSKETKFHVNKNNNPVGINALWNHFHYSNDQIPLEWLNKSFLAYKIECKKNFLTHWLDFLTNWKQPHLIDVNKNDYNFIFIVNNFTVK